MKKSIFTLVLISIFAVNAVAQQGKAQKNDPVGTWKFDAPSAPEGYTSGAINVAFAEKKYSANMSFAGGGSKLTGENVKFENDSLLFSVFIEEQEIKVTLKFTEPLKMAGKAVWSDGEASLSLTKGKKTE